MYLGLSKLISKETLRVKYWYFNVSNDGGDDGDDDDDDDGGGGDGLNTPANQTVRRNKLLITRNRRMDMHI